MPFKFNPTLFILFASCAVIQLLYPTDIIEVLPFIICAITAGLVYYTDKPLIKRLALIFYLILSGFFPAYILFIPVILYAFIDENTHYWLLTALFPYLMHIQRLMAVQDKVFLSLILTLMACLLKYQQNYQMRLKRDLTQTSDAMRELTLHLNEKNRLLMAHQDDEIHLATLNERNRIAREMHDHVGHQLSRVLLQIGAQLTLKPADPALLSMKETLDSAMDNLRMSVHDLHDTSIDLETQLRQIVTQFENCPVAFNIRLDAAPAAKVKYAFIAILKESLSNVSKHSSATEVKVSLIEHPSFYQMIISDNGKVANRSDIDGKSHSGENGKNGYALYDLIHANLLEHCIGLKN
ncbi:MAG TPA: histidine kinase, partial [Fusibacter sp.]|nr:histidine kinase [Fusibacter sp.]